MTCISTLNTMVDNPDWRREDRTMTSSGYWLQQESVAGKERRFDHWIGGGGGIDGPRCPNCQKPLLQLAKLDGSDRRVGLPDRLQQGVRLLYCWTCVLSQTQFTYQCTSTPGEERVLVAKRGEVVDGFPYPDYPVAFPGVPVRLEAVTPEEARAIHALNEGEVPARGSLAHSLSEPRHQVRGVPYEMQPFDAPVCSCGERMEFLASLGDATFTGRGFTDNPYVQVAYHLCGTCAIVGVRHYVD